jgi:hypothetical protein
MTDDLCIMTSVRCKLKKAANRPVSLRAAIAAYRKGKKVRKEDFFGKC